MLLLPNSKNACFNALSQQLPGLLNQAGINISLNSRNELQNLIQRHVEYMYYSSTGTEAFLNAIFLFLPMIAKAFGPYAVLIPEDCLNQELKNLSRQQLKTLDNLIFTHVLSNYRDQAREQQLERQAARQENRENRENPVMPAPIQPTYRNHGPNFNTRSPLAFAQNNPNNVRIQNNEELNKLLAFLIVFIVFMFNMLNNKNDTCPANNLNYPKPSM